METMAPARGPASDSGARRPRTFQCRDALWESLEHLSTELECTVDFLVNDAIKHYLRQRQRLVPHPLPAAPRPHGVERATPPAQTQPLTPSSQYRPLAPPPLPVPPPAFAPPPPGFAPPPPAFVPPAGFAPPPPGFVPPRAPLPPLRAPAPPPPLPPRALAPLPPLPVPAAPPPLRAAPPPVAGPARLMVAYADRTIEVDRPGFIIGRGKQAAGLTIKDPNISRCHATIEQQDGVYWLVDMGSTNGTLVNGQPVQRKAIADGDVAKICDHEIRFSFRR